MTGQAEKRRIILNLKGRPEFRQWLRECSKATGRPVSQLVEKGLALYAKHAELPEPPAR